MNRVIHAAPLLVLIAGCGTIDQVPLAYVSTVRVGISAETATAQVPGGKLVIGVEATDAAMVPVAIGRTCAGRVGERCDAGVAPIQLVTGNNDIGPAAYVALAQARADAVRTASQAIRLAETDLATAARATVQAQVRDDQQRGDRGTLALLEAERSADASTALAATGGMPDPAARRQAAARDARILALRGALAAESAAPDDVLRARQHEAAAEQRLTDAYATLDSKQRDLAAALDAHPAATGQRQDALSVFGSFNANGRATGTASGIGLTLGKSFSTGVAAQLLTEGLKQAAASTAAEGCLKQALAIRVQDATAFPVAIQACAGGDR